MQHRKFEGPAITMGENWTTKIAAKRIENVGSIFSGAILVTQPPTHSPPLHRNHRRTLDG